MSKAYELFIAQYRSTGRSHGDGYSAAMFSGMSTSESDSAFTMLAAAALDGDSTAVDALRHFGKEISTDVLVKAVKSVPSPLAALVAAATLHEFSHDESWVSSLVDVGDQEDFTLLWTAIQMIPDRKLEDPSVQGKAARLVEKYLVRDEEVRVMRRVAAKKLLAVYGFNASDAVGLALLVRLTDGRKEQRLAAVEDLICGRPP